jgi:16S rRNA (cytosine967-C5)-methyltransferase
MAEAARSVSAMVTDGRSLDAALAPYESSPQRSAVRAIALGTTRWYLRLAPAVDRLLERPKGLGEIHALLVTAAHQIEYSRNPPETTVNAAVDAARLLKAPRSAGLVNAVLRRFARERETLLTAVDREIPVRMAHPRWLVSALQAAWPQDWMEILAASNEHPPMTLRVNLQRLQVAQYLDQLAAAGLASRALKWLPGAVVLERPVPVTELPGFKEGLVSVQDAGAQLAATLLDARPGMRVLDACAAPGGKTAHLLERTPGLDLMAVDVDAGRLARIKENLQRLGASAELVAADVRELTAPHPFERILVDAPCSATGVIRRHPDIKLLRRAQDIPTLATLQLQIVRACLALLAPGGRLLYCTCSLLPAENQDVMERVLEAEPSARAISLSPASELAPGAVDRVIGVQLRPGTEARSDGFYYACVEKTTGQGSEIRQWPEPGV